MRKIEVFFVLTQKTDLLRQIRETENSLSLLIGDQAHSIARGKLDNQSRQYRKHKNMFLFL